MSDVTIQSDTVKAVEAAQKKRRNWRTMIALSFGYFIDQGEGQAMSVLFPTLQGLWGLSYSQLGLIGTIRNILQSITAPFWGYTADKFPRKNVIVFGTGIWGIWTALCGFSQNYEQLLALRAISGIGLGCLMPATFSLISDAYPPHKRGRALGLCFARRVQHCLRRPGMVPVPWILCAAIYTFFYFTYPRDSAKLRAQMSERAHELHLDEAPT